MTFTKTCRLQACGLIALACVRLRNRAHARAEPAAIGAAVRRSDRGVRGGGQGPRMPPKCATLFVGASSIRFWRTLKEDFPDRTVIQRGFGGSTVWEVNPYFDRVVAPYHPKEIVFYAGENDLWIAKRTPDEAYADFVQFMKLKDKALG